MSTQHQMRYDLAAWLLILDCLEFLGANQNGNACSVCWSDRSAAVYSYADEQRARELGDTYVTVEVLGLVRREQVPSLIHALRSIGSIRPKSIHVSYEYRSASFVYRKGAKLEDIAAKLHRLLGAVAIRRFSRPFHAPIHQKSLRAPHQAGGMDSAKDPK